MVETNTIEKIEQVITNNNGTGAGGANTNYYGKIFEEKTNNRQRLIDMGYTQNNFTKNQKTKKPKMYMTITCQKHSKIKQLSLYYKMD